MLKETTLVALRSGVPANDPDSLHQPPKRRTHTRTRPFDEPHNGPYLMLLDTDRCASRGWGMVLEAIEGIGAHAD
jgi:hypothetical protein